MAPPSKPASTTSKRPANWSDDEGVEDQDLLDAEVIHDQGIFDAGGVDDDDLLDAERVIDPALLTADRVMHILAPLSGDADDIDEEAFLIDALAGLDVSAPAGGNTNPLLLPATHFVSYFAKINVTKSQSISRLSETKFLAAAKQLPHGNSRDFPTRYIFHCRNLDHGCPYQTTEPARLDLHHRTCRVSESNPYTSATKEFACRYQPCDKAYSSNKDRNHHEKQYHEFKHRTCNAGCTDGKVYTNEESWRKHMRAKHSNWDQTTLCTVPRCQRKTWFPNRERFLKHLRDTHRLDEKDRKQYM